MDKSRYRCWTLHGIWQPDVQWEHSTLTSTSDEHQNQSGRNDEATSSNSLGDVTLDEWCSALAHHDVASEVKAERINEVAEGKDTNEEEPMSR